jgi:hypothetical protein
MVEHLEIRALWAEATNGLESPPAPVPAPEPPPIKRVRRRIGLGRALYHGVGGGNGSTAPFHVRL